jgi:proteasome lid subunit RPN8/RPN11
MLLLIHMSGSFYAELIQYCRSKLPNEACGFIIGYKHINTYQALSLFTITNVSHDPAMHFAMKPNEALSVFQDKSLFSQLIGIFHSHPSSNAEPSQEDLQTLWHAIPTHWIVSFMELENPVLQIRQIKKASPISSSKLSFVVDQ